MWKQYLKDFSLTLFLASLVLLSGCQNAVPEKKQNTQHANIRYVAQNGIKFSHESGVYEAAELKVHMQAPEGYTIAFTTNGTIPSGKDASGKTEWDVTLNCSMSGYLMDHKQKMFCPALPGSVLFQDDS